MSRRRLRLARALLAAAVVLVVALVASALAANQHRAQATERAAAIACRYPTDVAGLRSLRQQARTSGVDYISAVKAMYHRCPGRGAAIVAPPTRFRSFDPATTDPSGQTRSRAGTGTGTGTGTRNDGDSEDTRDEGGD